MAAGFPLKVNGIQSRTSEALYQACRFPDIPKVQREIISQASPMAGKMKSKPHRSKTRSDWDHVNVDVMWWCLQVKLIQNWDTFWELLKKTGRKSIVEDSHKDTFWRTHC